MGLTGVKVGADHLFAVDGVEAGQPAGPSGRLVAVQLGVGEASGLILLQPVTPAVPRHPPIRTRGFRVDKGLCREGRDSVSYSSKSDADANMMLPDK